MPSRLTVLATTVLLALAAGGLACTAVSLARPAVVPPDAASLAADVAVLASPEMEGRGSGTPGGDRAARRLVEWLAAAGLTPGGDDGTFFQSFPISAGMALADTNVLELETPVARTFEVERDWRPHGGSLTGEVSGDVVFVGNGMAAADGRSDDYAGRDVAGRIAIALDGDRRDAGSRAPTRLEKLIGARRHGARALLLVADQLPPLSATRAPVGIVSATITRSVAAALLGPRGLEAAVPRPVAGDSASPTATATGRVRLRIALRREERRAANVIAVLPGRAPDLAREAVVVGAHYDHLGLHGGAIHPGADDNASGSAIVVGLARSFRAAGGFPRTLVFALFAGEEMGLLGSGHYTRAPRVPLDHTVAMLNLDMVGRMRDRRLVVGGTDSGSHLRALVASAAREAGVTVDGQGDPFGASDHARFYRAGIPVLFFHTGSHDDYHQPSDTPGKINADGMARAAAVAVSVVAELASGPRPAYVAMSPRKREATVGAGAFFGIVAEPHESGDGVRIADVAPGNAAARAGVREGDVLVQFAGRSLRSFDDLKKAIADKRPGDSVEVLYLRDGEDRTTTVALEARP